MKKKKKIQQIKNRKEQNKQQTQRWTKQLNRRQQLNTLTPTEKELDDVWHFDIELKPNNDKSEPTN